MGDHTDNVSLKMQINLSLFVELVATVTTAVMHGKQYHQQLKPNGIMQQRLMTQLRNFIHKYPEVYLFYTSHQILHTLYTNIINKKKKNRKLKHFYNFIIN